MQNIYLQPVQKATKSKEKIKLPILVPLFAAILLLLWTFTLAIYNLQQRHITNEVRMRLDSTRGLFNEQLSTDARLLGAIIDFLSNDPNLQNIRLTKDRNALLDYTAPLFEKLRRDYEITHFYFIDTNNTCFLRVHNPPRFGDNINRFTLLAASRDQKPSWGIEVGKFGTFTLRAVHPWFINGELTGFIELGEEIEHITPQLKKGFDVDLVFLIKKTLLTRDDWEEGLKVMGRSGNWDLIPDRVIVDSTIPVIPPEFIQFAGMPHEQHKDKFVSATFNGSKYRAGCVPLIDAAGHSVGDILVIKNTTKDEASLHTLLAVVTVICLGVGALLVVLFYAHITRIEKRLLNAHASLETEIEKRKVIEAELRRHRDNLEEIVDSRTAEIEATNKHLQDEITVRKKAEDALRKSDERFKQVAQSAGDWIWEVNPDGLYTYSSPVAEKVLGYKTEEIVGKKHFYDFFTPETREPLRKAAFEVFNRKESFTGFVNAVIHKNGDTIILETTGTPVLDDEGNLCGYRGADRDITERKNAEKALEKLNTDLELTVTQLSQSNRQLRDFAHIAAHDLKTPLRGIGMLAQWLSEDYRDKFDDTGQRQIDLLVKRVERMDKLIDVVLKYSTIARNKQNERKVDLNLLLNVILAEIKPHHNIKITVNNDLPTIICDEKHIAQVFYNLLSNAVKFMNKPDGLITVGCVEENDPASPNGNAEASFLQFSVSDNGPGIEPQHFDRIFRLSQTLNDRDQYETTGAGLALTKKIVELYGGKIWLTSTVGVGSTFFFTLPKQPADVTTQTPQPAIS
jgi:PAS domain S-box-containing protein